MRFIGTNNSHCETGCLTLENTVEVTRLKSSELLIIWFTSNKNTIEIDNVKYQFKTNEVLCLTEFHLLKNVQITAAKFIKWDKYFYCIINHDSEVGCKGLLFYGAITLPVIQFSDERFIRFQQVWNLLEMEMTLSDSMQEEVLQNVLKRLLVECTREYKSQIGFKSVGDSVSDLIREYHFLVEKHFKEKHQVADYAEMLNKSPKTLANVFKQLGSKSPLQFIKDRKMLEAKRLLLNSSISITKIGMELGFSDLQTFSRFFKNQEGVAPNFYR